MHLLDFLLPRLCRLCGCLLTDNERYVCTGCLSRMPRTRYHRVDNNAMEQRFAGIFPFTRATGIFHYSRNSDIATLIQDFKYRHCPGMAEYLGEMAATELHSTGFFDDAEMIVPVPMHFMKRARRGYNQVDYLAKGIGRATGLPVVDALRARRPHGTQTRLSAEERRRNAAGLFSVRDSAGLDNRGILLVDDICTTGATLTSAAEAILDAAPSARITLFTLAVTF